jgi:hypothetical protein
MENGRWSPGASPLRLLPLCDIGVELYANDCGVAENLCCAVRDGAAGRDWIKNRRVGSWFPSSKDPELGAHGTVRFALISHLSSREGLLASS